MLGSVFNNPNKKLLKKAIKKAEKALEYTSFQKWLLKHANSGLATAKQAKNAERIKYFSEVIKILKG